jgi:hypothetical protein
MCARSVDAVARTCGTFLQHAAVCLCEVKEHAERLCKAPTPHSAEWLIALCRALQREMAGCALGRMVKTFRPIADAAARSKRPRVDWAEHKVALGDALAAMEGALAS